MIGGVVKYVVVLGLGAGCFSLIGHHMDRELLNAIKEGIDNIRMANSDLSPDDTRVKVQSYIRINRNTWTEQLTFASSLNELNLMLDGWI